MEKNIKFGDIEIEKQKFHQHKEPISIKNIDINKIAVSNRVSFGKKGFIFFIGYKDAKKVRPLCIFLQKMTAYTKDFDKTMFFFIKDDELLEKYNDIWKKIKDSLKRECDSKPVYNKIYIKAKVKSYNGNINTSFYNNKIRKADSQYICLSIILLDSVFRTGKSYYLQVFLEECKYAAKGKKIPKYIIGDIEIPSDSDRENSDEKSTDRENSDKEVSNEEN